MRKCANGFISDIAFALKAATRTSRSRRYHPHVLFYPRAFADGLCTFEDSVEIFPDCSLRSSSVGRHTYFAPGCSVQFADIGRFCSFGSNCVVGTGMHPTDRVSTHPDFYSQFRHVGTFHQDPGVVEHAPVTIGHDVWVGRNAIISDGIKIGVGAIVGAGAVVTKNVEPYMIVGGIPAKPIRCRFTPEVVDQLLSTSWWNWTDEVLHSLRLEFHSPEALMRQLGAVNK